MILHLVNYNEKQPAENIKVDIAIPGGKTLKQVNVLTPDGRPDENIPFTMNSRRAVFTVPKLAVYDMVVLTFE
ncbi:MAG: hypothetical protein JST39_15390 [Bacteroidetes bacterium]|nr:hypothetical protein [Bacteroidota bacterium]